MLRKSLLLISFAQTFLFAQYIPFPTDNAVWVNHEYNVNDWWPHWTLISIDNFCVDNQDTVINSLTYTKLNYCGGNYRGALRNNSGQVFFVSKDSVNEMLLYDFTVGVDDTLTDIYLSYYWFDTLFVSAVSSITIGGQLHKTIFLKDENHNDLPDYWIEGIGCSAGLLVDPFSNMNVSGWYNEFACFSSNDSIFNPQTNFSYQGLGSCQLNYLSDDQLFEEPFNIYPNPANESVNLVFNEIISGCIQIFDLSGKLIFSKNIAQAISHLLIDLTTFESGTYLVQLNSENGVIVRKLVVY